MPEDKKPEDSKPKKPSFIDMLLRRKYTLDKAAGKLPVGMTKKVVAKPKKKDPNALMSTSEYDRVRKDAMSD